MALEGGARGLQGAEEPLLPAQELQRGRQRAADRQPTRPLQGVREVLTSPTSRSG